MNPISQTPLLADTQKTSQEAVFLLEKCLRWQTQQCVTLDQTQQGSDGLHWVTLGVGHLVAGLVLGIMRFKIMQKRESFYL